MIARTILLDETNDANPFVIDGEPIKWPITLDVKTETVEGTKGQPALCQVTVTFMAEEVAIKRKDGSINYMLTDAAMRERAEQMAQPKPAA